MVQRLLSRLLPLRASQRYFSLPGAWQKTYDAKSKAELCDAYAAWAPTYEKVLAQCVDYLLVLFYLINGLLRMVG